MNLELKLALHLNSKVEQSEANQEIYLSNIYRIYGNLASAYQRLNNYQECLSNFEKQLEVSLEMKEEILVVHTCNSIGLTYNKLKEYEKSLESFEKAMELINAIETKENQTTVKKLKLNQFNLIGIKN